ncbi:MAG: sulfatase-like hydrolase/transferase [Thermoguttaceae bacterium]
MKCRWPYLPAFRYHVFRYHVFRWPPSVDYNRGMNAICLVIDRLHAGYIGAYGNSWIQTPSLDRLACEAFTFDQAHVDSPCPERLYRSYWQGWHAMGQPPSPERPSLAAMLRTSGVETALLTDDPAVAEHPSAADFDELIEIDRPWEAQGVDRIEQTHLAKCFVRAIDFLESARQPLLLWCHMAGLGTTWDAPLEFRQTYAEEGDPDPPTSAEVPDRRLAAGYDPDELLGITQSYAGQVSLLDTCLGAFLEFFESSPLRDDTMLVLTSPRGFPLGEHGRVGPCDGALYGELVHVPLMIRLPDGLGAAARSQALVGPTDLWATLLEVCGVTQPPPSPEAGSLMPILRQETDMLRDRFCILGEGPDRAIRTPAWALRTAAPPELFAKPDDRWEVNDVADRCDAVVQDLSNALAQYEQAIRADEVVSLPPLGQILLDGFE